MNRQMAKTLEEKVIDALGQLDRLPLKDRLDILIKLMALTVPRYRSANIRKVQKDPLQPEDPGRDWFRNN